MLATETTMAELVLLLGAFRRDPGDPGRTFVHRLRVGLLVASLILLSSCFG